MVDVTAHYATHLGPVYLWMAGGMEQALAQGEADLASLGLPAQGSGLALDLGAGFGMHAIPLARRGYTVTAVDTSALLLAELAIEAKGLPIRTIEADIRKFRNLDVAPPSLVVCMGDTLPHLPDLAAIEQLSSDVAQVLRPEGTFAVTFRDYTRPAKGLSRFIPVRSSPDRILTCFLEEAPDHIEVHDLLHERVGNAWNLKVSSYRKLRLDPQWVAAVLGHAGLEVRIVPAPRGMTGIVATRPGVA
jgi:SAM-dependent methyltransferase